MNATFPKEQAVPTQNRFRIPAGVVDLKQRHIEYVDGSRNAISRSEATLLRCLLGSPGQIVPREDLLRELWGSFVRCVSTRTIDMHMSNVRKKLRLEAGDNEVLGTVHRRGYVLNPAPADLGPELVPAPAPEPAKRMQPMPRRLQFFGSPNMAFEI